MLMQNRDDDRDALLTNEVCGVWKMAEQRTSYTLADFRKLVGKRADPFDRQSKLLGESSPTSVIVACVPVSGLLDVRLGTMPDNDGDHFLEGVLFSRSART